MQSICPKCGNPSLEGLCRNCIMQSTKLLRCPDQVEVTICSVCGSRQAKGKWRLADSRSIEELASQAAVDALWFHSEYEQPQIEIDLAKIGATRYLAKIATTGKFKGEVTEEQCRIPIRIKLMACDRCSRMAGKYFQSTVQVRGSGNRAITNEEQKECKNIAFSLADHGYHAGDQLSFIQEIKEVKGGLDMVLGSTQLGRHIARAMQERFGGRLLESCKLVGKNDSRDVYRSTLLIRFPRLKRGDIVSFRGSLFAVAGFDGKMTQISALRDGRRSSLSEENSETIEVLGNKTDSIKAVVVSLDENVLEIMDPETYKIILASRPKGFEIKPGAEVNVVRTANGFIVLE